MLDTVNATTKLMIAPTAPNDKGEMPNNQLSGVLANELVSLIKNQPKYKKIYTKVDNKPANIPAIAPVLFTRLEKIPIISTGKMDAAAIPKAKATTCAAKPGGLIPK